MQRIVMVGTGHLAHALWEGWHRVPSDRRTFALLARSDAHRALWDRQVWDRVCYEPSKILMDAAVVVLAVKPQDAVTALEKIGPYLSPSTILVSAIAGLTFASLRRTGLVGPLVRIMPNVNAAIGASTTLAAFDEISDDGRTEITLLLADCGTVTTVPEELINPFTALIGSGPAYIFLLLKSLVEGGRQLGVDPTLTRVLVSSMVEGSARLARDRYQDSLDEWINQVASPGGTTEALLRVLEGQGWPAMLQEAVVAAARRADALSAGRQEPDMG